MTPCELLEIVERLARLIDAFSTGRIDVVDFAREVKSLGPLIDQAVALDCPKHGGTQ